MMNYEVMNEINIKINIDNVLHLIDCYLDSPVYEEVIEEYNEMIMNIQHIINPKAVIKFGVVSDEMVKSLNGILKTEAPVVYVLLTIGDKIAELSSSYFAKGDYLKAVLVNAIADTYIFQMDEVIKERVEVSCFAKNMGISKRLEAPKDYPMLVQKNILDEIKEVENLDIDVTEGFMFSTIKTSVYILVLTNDEKLNNSDRNCSNCTSNDCKLRKIPEVKNTLTSR